MSHESQRDFESDSTHGSGVISTRPASEKDTVGIPEVEAPLEVKAAIDFPDGGLRAWLIVFGSFCTTFATFGYVNSWGVFQTFYEENTLKSSSPSDIAWIGSVQYAFIFLPLLITGRLFDMGYFKPMFLVASIVEVVATFLIAECEEYWEFLLCQGFAVGISAGLVFGPALSVIPHWFSKKRGLALGVTAVGSSLGGVIFPIMTRHLLQDVGFKWTIRIIGFMLLFMFAIANLTLERRLPPKHVSGGIIDLRVLKNASFSIYCLCTFFTYLGLYTVLTFIELSGVSIGLSPDFASYLISIANAASTVGRFASGVLADRWGPVNVMVPATAIAGIMTFAWPFAQSKGSLIAIAVIYGMSSGAFTALLTAPPINMGDTHDVGRRMGLCFAILALGAIAGPPISGAINTSTGGFKYVGIYAGSCIELGVVLMLLSRHLALGRVRGKF